VFLWESGSGRCATLSGHTGIVHALAFGPGDALLASGGSDGTVRLWDVATAREVGRIHGDGSAVLAVAFSPDGRWIVYGTVGGLVTAEPVDPFAFARNQGLRPLTPAERARFAVGDEAEQAAANAEWRKRAGLPEPR
jgi:hypothetical protein